MATQRLVLLVLVALSAAALAACESGVGAGTEAESPLTYNHFHGLGYNSEARRIYIATHSGLYSMDEQKRVRPVAPSLGDVMGFVMNPRDPRVMYASGHPLGWGNMGVIKSTDGGETWTTIFTGPGADTLEFHTTALSRVDTDVLVGYHDGPLYVTEDAGSTWRRTAGALPAGDCWGAPCLAFDSEERTRLYASTQEGLYRSDDLGESWMLLSPEIFGGIAVHPLNSQVLFASRARDIVRSGDGGKTWIKTGDLTLEEGERAFAFVFDERNLERTLFATTAKRIFVMEPSGAGYRISQFY